MIQIYTIVSQPFGENTYIMWHKGRSEALVIDPGMEPDQILDFLQRNNLSVAAILNTHGHLDHIAGNQAIKSAYPLAPIVIGANDANMLVDANANMSAIFGLPVTSPPADLVVSEGDVMSFADISLEVLDVPGHSPGHIAFVLRGEPCRIFAGDVLFQGSIGRTDFPGGDFRLLSSSIRKKLYIFPDDTIIYPGHGQSTTIGEEKQTNPFVSERAG